MSAPLLHTESMNMRMDEDRAAATADVNQRTEQIAKKIAMPPGIDISRGLVNQARAASESLGRRIVESRETEQRCLDKEFGKMRDYVAKAMDETIQSLVSDARRKRRHAGV